MRIVYFLLLIVGLVICGTTYRWESIDINLPEIQDICTAAFDDKIFLFGGWNEESAYNTLFEFNPETGNLTDITSLLNNVPDITIGCTMNRIGDRLLIVGGANESQDAKRNCFWFDPGNYTWEPAPSLLRGTAWHSSALSGSELFVFFGWSDGTPRTPCYGPDPRCLDTNYVQIFNTETNSWTVQVPATSATPWPSYREGVGALLAPDNNFTDRPVILLYGGTCIGCDSLVTNVYFKDLWVFYTDTKEFELLDVGGDTQYRCFMSIFSSGGTIFAFGGSSADRTGIVNYFNDVVRLGPDFDKWTTETFEGKVPLPRWSMSTVTSEDGRLFLFGGASATRVFSDANEIQQVSTPENKKYIVEAVLGTLIPAAIILAAGVAIYCIRKKNKKPKEVQDDFFEKHKQITPGPSAMLRTTAPWILPAHLILKSPEELEIMLSKTILNFGLPEEAQLEIGVTYEDTIVIATGRKNATLANTEFKLHYPTMNHKFSLKCTPEFDKIRSGKTATILVQLVVHCTATIDAEIAIAITDLGCTKVAIRKKSVLSTALDYEDIQIGAEVGEGGFSKVYKGLWRGTEVAVKILKNQHLSEAETIEFNRETDVMNKLRHPNITSFIGSVHTPGHRCFVTEYIKLGSLDKVMKQHALGIKQKVKFSLDIAKAMKFLHNSGILHRDLKPPNFLVASLSSKAETNVKLADFGTSRAIASSQEKNFTKAIGTPIYMAPEVLASSEYTTPADIYSFGVLLLEIVSGEQPYQDLAFTWDIAAFVLAGNRPSIPESMNLRLSTLITQCWAQNPKDRPDFNQITITLASILSELGYDKIKSSSRLSQSVVEEPKEHKIEIVELRTFS